MKPQAKGKLIMPYNPIGDYLTPPLLGTGHEGQPAGTANKAIKIRNSISDRLVQSTQCSVCIFSATFRINPGPVCARARTHTHTHCCKRAR